LAKKQVDLMGDVINLYIDEFRKYVQEDEQAAKRFRKLQDKNAEDLSRAEKVSLKRRIAPEIAKIYLWVHSFKFTVVSQQTKCVKSIGEVRLNSICYTCSARANLYFLGDKLRVEEMMCRRIISKCSASWSSLIEFLDKVNQFNGLIKELEVETGIKFSQTVAGSPAKSILDWADQNNLRQNLNHCENGLCKFDTAKNICENFLSINHPIYLRKALGIVGNIIDKSKYVLEEIRKSSKSKKRHGHKKGHGSKHKKGRKSSRVVKQPQSTLSNTKQLIEKFIGIRNPAMKPASKNGRSLLSFPPKAKSASSSNSTTPAMPGSSELAKAPQSNSKAAYFNPLYCTSESTCNAEKVIVPSSQCGSSNHLCTNPSVEYSGV